MIQTNGADNKMSNSKAVKASIGYTIGNYLLKGLSFLTIPIFTRLLSTEDYGIVNTFTACESIMFVIIGFAIHSSFKNARYRYKLTSEGAEAGTDYRTYVSNAFLLIWISGVTWMAFTIIFRNPVSQVLKLDSRLVMLLIANSMCNAILIAYNSDVSINYEFKKYLIIAVFHSVGNILVSLALILFVWPKFRYVGRIVGTVVPMVAIGVYLTINQLKKNKPSNFISMMKWGLKYSLPIVPHGISQIILSSFDRIMITNMISNSATGLYSFAYNIFTILQVTSASIDTVWNPWFYEKRKENDFDAIREGSTMYVVFLLSFASFIMLISPELVYILGGSKYSDSLVCVIPVVCSGFFTFLYNIPAMVEYYHEQTKSIALATMCAAGVNIVANYIFIRRYGYVAAAYTTLATYFLYFLFHYFMARRVEGRSLFSGTAIVISTCGIIVIGAVSLLTVNLMWLRFVLAVVVLAGFLSFVEKKMKIVTEVIKKIRR